MPTRLRRWGASAAPTGVVLLALCVNGLGAAEWTLAGAGFKLMFDSTRGGVTSLQLQEDVLKTEYIKSGALLDDLALAYRRPGQAWAEVRLADASHRITQIDRTQESVEVRLALPQQVRMTKSLTLQGDRLSWLLEISNESEQPLEIGDIALPMQLNTDYVGGDLQTHDAIRRTYQNRLNQHRLIAGHGSFLCWMRANGVGPYLVMLPDRNTPLEYFDAQYPAFVHSAYTANQVGQGTWRLPHTRRHLDAAGGSQDRVRYGFTFAVAKSIDDVRDVLYEHGGFDIHVIPGMTLPVDLTAVVALRTKQQIQSVQPEYPAATKITYRGETQTDVHLYELTFSRLGENFVRINYEGGRHLLLEFFSTEPLETLYRKRARFITSKQQHRNELWYDGLFSLWDMRTQRLRSPDDLGGLQDYMVGGSDDPSNSKAVLVAEKNVFHPAADEISALEYYLQHFVWGKLQRTDREQPHPYGIYGSENWYLNRHTRWGTMLPDRIRDYEATYGVPEGTGLGAERLWRSFDYTTFIMLYYDMYRIAKQYPHLVNYLDAQGYLQRAYGTARAYFQVPYSIHMVGKPLWSHKGYCDWAYKRGNFHERYITDVIEALHHEGMPEQAEWLRGEWEKKVKYFLYDDPFPFGSEFVFDRTAFESTHAVARYAIEHPLQPDKKLWYDRNLNRWYSHPDVRPEHAADFMERQIRANVSMRGWLETSYYYLGSARVGANTLDYMSQMAGWSILDYGLYFSDDHAKYVRLGYASLLSSWALVNSGTAETDYGYWYPGKANDGAAGWAFQTQKQGKTWAVGTASRGIWPYGGESDHGMAGAIRAAATVVLDDPIFGRIALGGTLESEAGNTGVVPRDGVRRRLHWLTADHKVHLRLDADGFQKWSPVEFEDDFERIAFHLENRAGRAHTMTFEIQGLPDGDYEVLRDKKRMHSFTSRQAKSARCPVPVTSCQGHAIRIRRL